jgi:hypothetical protein
MATVNPKVLEARARRTATAAASKTRWEWYLKEVNDKVAMTMRQRVRTATEYLKSRVIQNISRPVTKVEGKRSGRIVVIDRSRSGEFPKADTTQLLKTIFSDVLETTPGVWDGFVGTPLDYGAILETSARLNRSFLVRTLNEERETITKMLTGPLK